MTQKVRLVTVGTLAMVGGVGVSIALYHWRPLVQAPEISVTYSDGASSAHPCVAYRMLFRPDRIFVRLPDDARPGHVWLAVDLSRRLVAVPNAPESTPYLHFNHDMSLGVAADDAVKLTTPWTVSWDDAGFTARAGDATVHIERP